MIAVFYLSGISTAMFAIAGIFFLKFWKVSRDQFFLYLSSACALLSTERLLGLVTSLYFAEPYASSNQVRSWLYLFRLAAFSLILFSIWQKNRKPKAG